MKRQLTNQVNRRHARIVLLSRGGLPNARIAEHCDCTPPWVRRILHRFNTGSFAATKDGTTFLPFLESLRRRYRRTETLHVVLDNAGYHLKAEVQQYAATHNIRFYGTPTEASWLNRIESHLTALRKFALDNTDWRNHDEQQGAIESYLRGRNGERPINILNGETYCWQAKKAG